MTSYFKTAILLAGMTALFLGVGWLIGGQGGLLIALVFALGTNLFAYWNSDKVVLRMHNAREVDARTAPRLYRMVQELAGRAGLPMPRVYLIENPQPNAFATGRNPENAAVAATTGLLDLLSEEQVAGVIAHELAHIKNRDTLIMTIAATIAGALSMIANFAFFFGAAGQDARQSPLGPIGIILAALAAPFVAMIVQMAISRTREFEADRIGAEICGRPSWLADALVGIQHGAARIPNHQAERNPATAHLFIINPLHGGGVGKLFSTHPPTEERVRRLRAMAGGAGPGSFRQPAGGPWGPGAASGGPWGR